MSLKILNFYNLALDRVFGFAIIKVVNPTALSACRDGSLFYMNTKKVFVFIDGGNFYFKLKELNFRLDKKFSLLNFQYSVFNKL